MESAQLTDRELRDIVLRRFYERRDEGAFEFYEKDLSGFPEVLKGNRLFAICDQLAELELITWKPARMHGFTVRGFGKISVKGVQAVEGDEKVMAGNPIHISGGVFSGGSFQFGANSTQTVNHAVNLTIGQIQAAIEKSDASADQKAEAKSLIARAIEHPLTQTVIGGLVGALIQK